jgi:hypothetical protein
MTLTAVAAKPRTGRSLVTDTEFETLAAFCADEYGLERCVADRVVDQALALVFVMGSSSDGASMAPSQQVEDFWSCRTGGDSSPGLGVTSRSPESERPYDRRRAHGRPSAARSARLTAAAGPRLGLNRTAGPAGGVPHTRMVILPRA